LYVLDIIIEYGIVCEDTFALNFFAEGNIIAKYLEGEIKMVGS